MGGCVDVTGDWPACEPLPLELLRRGLETRAGMSRAHENADRYGDTFELRAVLEKGDSVLAVDMPYRAVKSLLWGYMALADDA